MREAVGQGSRVRTVEFVRDRATRRLALCLVTVGSLLGLAGDEWQVPDARAHHQLVWDEDEERVYLVGGSTRRGDGYHYFDDVWTWDGEGWSPGTPLPFPRSSHGVVHNGTRESLVLFGGGFQRATKAEGVIWERGPSGWRAIAGHVDAGRDEPGLCYDQARDRLVLFGGWDREAEYRGETWEWSGASLERVDVEGPAPRAGHAFLYDPVLERCLLFGGRGPDGYLDDTWTWDGAAWERLATDGPPARWFFGSATDETLGRIVIFGGDGPAGDLDDTWVWEGEHWSRLDIPGPPARSMARMAYSDSGLVLFGGRRATADGFTDLQDTWALVGDDWVHHP